MSMNVKSEKLIEFLKKRSYRPRKGNLEKMKSEPWFKNVVNGVYGELSPKSHKEKAGAILESLISHVLMAEQSQCQLISLRTSCNTRDKSGENVEESDFLQVYYFIELKDSDGNKRSIGKDGIRRQIKFLTEKGVLQKYYKPIVGKISQRYTFDISYFEQFISKELFGEYQLWRCKTVVNSRSGIVFKIKSDSSEYHKLVHSKSEVKTKYKKKGRGKVVDYHYFYLDYNSVRNRDALIRNLSFLNDYNGFVAKNEIYLNGKLVCGLKLWRQFSDSECKAYGRFHHGLQNLPSSSVSVEPQELPVSHRNLFYPGRELIEINGEVCVELDFGAMVPTLLSLELGYEPRSADDIYSITGEYSCLNYYSGESLEEKVKNRRKFIKTSFNMLINITNKNIQCMTIAVMSECRSYLAEENYKKTEKVGRSVIEQVIAQNPQISEYKNMLKDKPCLFKAESDICMKVLIKMMKQDILVIPIHDSFIVAKKHKGALRTAMQEAFLESYPHWTGLPSIK